jgi:hypothetical protein
MKMLIGILLIAFVGMTSIVAAYPDDQLPQGASTKIPAEKGDSVNASAIKSKCKDDNLRGRDNNESEELRIAQSGCQLHLYPCGTCSTSSGSPGSILIREDCSQTCEKCGN